MITIGNLPHLFAMAIGKLQNHYSFSSELYAKETGKINTKKENEKYIPSFSSFL